MQHQYSWGIAIGLLTVVGTIAAVVAFPRSEKRRSLSAKIQFATTAAIFLVFVHNIWWENEIHEAASRGWTLLYTFPPFLICSAASIILTVAFTIRARELRTDRTTSKERAKT